MSQSRKEQRAEAAEARRTAREEGGPSRPAGTSDAARARPAGAWRERMRAKGAEPRYRATQDRPEGIFGTFPVSEMAIVAGVILVVLGFTQGPTGDGRSRMIGGIALCAVGVFEFTTREHFKGYRSHTALLAGVPAMVVHGIALLIAPSGSVFLYVVLVPDVIVYALAFQVLRSVYKRAEIKRLAESQHS